MKLFKREPTKLILFVCVENAVRSQMAEGYFNKYAPKGYEAISAGTRPVSQINPFAVQVMRESGIDISNQKSKELTEDMMRFLKYSKHGMCGKRIMSNAFLAEFG